MINNLNFSSSDPTLEKDMVTLIDNYTEEIINYQKIPRTVNNGVIYRLKNK